MSSVGTFQLVLPSFPSSSSSSFTNTTLSLRPLPFPTSPLQRHPHLNRNLQHFDAISLQHRSKSGRNFGSFPCFSGNFFFLPFFFILCSDCFFSLGIVAFGPIYLHWLLLSDGGLGRKCRVDFSKLCLLFWIGLVWNRFLSRELIELITFYGEEISGDYGEELIWFTDFFSYQKAWVTGIWLVR